MTKKIPITVARGDGIGPEIMDATLRILEAARAPLAIEEIKIGKEVYESGASDTGITDEAWDSLRRTKVFLKAPITTPQGGGFKSLNVTIRKALGLYANVRPCVSYAPYIKTAFPGMDIVIVRENEEDLYGGIEYRQTQNVMLSLKLVTRQGCERIVRYAFEYARANGRKKVTCMTKDNIMKIADGLFHKVFDEISAEYPEIEKEHMIIDIGTARIAAQPHHFDVIVTLNLYGDIISDVAAEITGSVGLGGSSNIGQHCAMFEAIHGSAPDIAGKGVANPSGLLLGAIMMLVHLGLGETAETLHNAWLKTIEDGLHTGDIYRAGESKERVGTKAFADAVIQRLGQKPEKFRPVSYRSGGGAMEIPALKAPAVVKKDLTGVDVYIDAAALSAGEIAEKVASFLPAAFKLAMISNRGVQVWPNGVPETNVSDQWRLRFIGTGAATANKDVVALLDGFLGSGLDFIRTEHLYNFGGVPGYSEAKG